MIIKATRIRASAGAGALVRHLLAGDDNEAISIIRGTVADVGDAVKDARTFSRTYAIRHFVIAPAVQMDHAQFHHAVTMLGSEFGFDPATTLIVEHTKTRVVAGVADRHWHVVVAETDPATGRVLSSSFDRARHEKLARQIELLFGHPIIGGAHDIAVLAALRAEGNGDLASRLDAQFGTRERPAPAAAFTTSAHQAAKRAGVDLALVRENIRAACAGSPSGAVLLRILAAQGLAIEQGDKPGVWVVRGSDGQFLGAAHRLSGLRKADFTRIMETNDDHPNQHRTGNLVGPAGNPAGDGHNPRPGEEHRLADARRDSVGFGHDGIAAANDRERHRTEPPQPGSPSPATGRAGHRPGPAPDDRVGLIHAVQRLAQTLVALNHRGIGASPAQRVRQHLSGLEAKVHAEIAAIHARPVPDSASRLYAARLYRDGTTARHDALLTQYRAIEAQMAAPAPQPTFRDRLMGRRPETPSAGRLEREHAAVRRDLIDAERSLTKAIGHLAFTERAASVERVAHQQQTEALLRDANLRLGEIVRAQKIATAFPRIVYAGPVFTAWAGQKIERKRRDGPRNPWATNLWGVPIDFGEH